MIDRMTRDLKERERERERKREREREREREMEGGIAYRMCNSDAAKSRLGRQIGGNRQSRNALSERRGNVTSSFKLESSDEAKRLCVHERVL